MIIRSADMEKDALSIVDGAHEFVDTMGISQMFPDNEQDFIDAVARIVTLDGVEIYLAEHDEKIVGGIGIIFAPYMWNPAKIVGEELFWWAYKGAPFRTGKLLYDEAMKNIKDRGAIPSFKALKNSPKGVAKMYEKTGLSQIETSYMGLSWH